MSWRRKYEAVCDYAGNEPCRVVGSVMAINKADATRQLVRLGWSSYDKGQDCIHYCPIHNQSTL